jgi:hypothetical protein
VTLKEVLPRIVVIVIFIIAAIFAYIESLYMRDHAISLGDKGSSVTTWIWIYRVIAMALLFASSYVAGGFWRR